MCGEEGMHMAAAPVILQALSATAVGRNRFIAPFRGQAPSMVSAGPWQEWRNKAIAPYGPCEILFTIKKYSNSENSA